MKLNQFLCYYLIHYRITPDQYPKNLPQPKANGGPNDLIYHYITGLNQKLIDGGHEAWALRSAIKREFSDILVDTFGYWPLCLKGILPEDLQQTPDALPHHDNPNLLSTLAALTVHHHAEDYTLRQRRDRRLFITGAFSNISTDTQQRIVRSRNIIDVPDPKAKKDFRILKYILKYIPKDFELLTTDFNSQMPPNMVLPTKQNADALQNICFKLILKHINPTILFAYHMTAYPNPNAPWNLMDEMKMCLNHLIQNVLNTQLYHRFFFTMTHIISALANTDTLLAEALRAECFKTTEVYSLYCRLIMKRKLPAKKLKQTIDETLKFGIGDVVSVEHLSDMLTEVFCVHNPKRVRQYFNVLRPHLSSLIDPEKDILKLFDNINQRIRDSQFFMLPEYLLKAMLNKKYTHMLEILYCDPKLVNIFFEAVRDNNRPTKLYALHHVLHALNKTQKTDAIKHYQQILRALLALGANPNIDAAIHTTPYKLHLGLAPHKQIPELLRHIPRIERWLFQKRKKSRTVMHIIDKVAYQLFIGFSYMNASLLPGLFTFGLIILPSNPLLGIAIILPVLFIATLNIVSHVLYDKAKKGKLRTPTACKILDAPFRFFGKPAQFQPARIKKRITFQPGNFVK